MKKNQNYNSYSESEDDSDSEDEHDNNLMTEDGLKIENLSDDQDTFLVLHYLIDNHQTIYIPYKSYNILNNSIGGLYKC